MGFSQKQDLQVFLLIVKRGTIALDVVNYDFGRFFEDTFEFIVQKVDSLH